MKWVFFILMVLSFSLVARKADAEVRVALVIGNGAYRNVPRLVNPINDANDVAAALKRDGFDTILATDLDKDQMDAATIAFARAARSADIAMFYYSGHALQFAGSNYLAPIDAKLTDEADLRRMVRLDEVVNDLQQAKNLRILVLDSCRNNPLANELRRSMGTSRALPLQRGLAKIDTPLGMIVSYSTQAGTEADDGNGRNSPYTAAFLKHIEVKDEIGAIFRRISADVYESTDHRQLPELSLSLIGEFYLRGRIEGSIEPEKPFNPPDETKDDFAAAERIDTPGAWAAFLARHPDGYYATLAKERRAKLQSTTISPDNVVKPTPLIEANAPDNEDRYLAVAASSNTGSWGASNSGGEATRELAEGSALSACRRYARDCRAVGWSKNACSAIARGNDTAKGWSNGWDDIEDARRTALRYCNERDRAHRCKVVWSACAKPS
jgi:caspase domain-containing protein/uncharacterized protein DUF4189